MALIGRIRENVGLLVFVIALAILAFLLMDVMSNPGNNVNEPMAGNVNGMAVTERAFQARYQQLLDNAQSSGRTLDDNARMQMREQAWNAQVQDVLSKGEYQKLGLTVTDSEAASLFTGDNVHSSIKSAPLFQDAEGNFSKDKLRTYIATFDDPSVADGPQRRARWKAFEKSVLDEQLRNKYVGLVSKGIYIPEWFVKHDHANKNKQANISYAFVPYTSVEDGDVSISDSDLKSYLNKHQNEFKQDAARSIDYSVLKVEPSAQDDTRAKNYIANQINDFRNAADVERFLKIKNSETPYQDSYVTKEELKSSVSDSLFSVSPGTVIGPFLEAGAYKAIRLIDRKTVPESVEVRQIFVQAKAPKGMEGAKALIDSIKTVLKNGGDFESLASSHSDDESKENGGNLGFVKRDATYPPQMMNAFFYDYKQGDQFTLELPSGILLAEILTSKPTLQAVKIGTFSQNIIPSSETEQSFFGKAQQLSGNSNNASDFKANAEKMGLTVQTASKITPNTFNIPGLGVTSDIATWAFQNDIGAVSKRIFTVEDKATDGSNRTQKSFVVATITGATNEGVARIDDVRTALENAVRNEKKAAQIIDKIGANTDVNAVASANAGEVKKAENVSIVASNITGMGNEPDVQAAIFGLEAGATSAPIAGERGVYVVKVDSYLPQGVPGDIEGDKKTLATPLRTAATAGVLNALVKAADVSDDRFKNRR